MSKYQAVYLLPSHISNMDYLCSSREHEYSGYVRKVKKITRSNEYVISLDSGLSFVADGDDLFVVEKRV